MKQSSERKAHLDEARDKRMQFYKEGMEEMNTKKQQSAEKKKEMAIWVAEKVAREEEEAAKEQERRQKMKREFLSANMQLADDKKARNENEK